MGDPLSILEILLGGIFIIALALLAFKAKAIDSTGAIAGSNHHFCHIRGRRSSVVNNNDCFFCYGFCPHKISL